MRADRLIALVMLLQTRGKLSARQLAQELEVSERTVYRDMVALSAAGIPVYGEAGPEGGYALVDSYRTSLTGLTESETQALFMLSIPEPLKALGLGQELKAALLKLAAALPAARRVDEERVRQRFHLDASWWRQGEEPLPYLKVIHQAVWQDQKLVIRYRVWAGRTDVERLVEPYGLVAKAGVWYLVCAWQGRARVKRVSSLLEARLSEEHFERPADFDLVAFWNAWRQEEEERYSDFRALIRVAPDFIPALAYELGSSVRQRIEQSGEPDEHGWVRLELFFESLYEARRRILGFGGGVEVLEPLALRMSVMDMAEQIRGVYGAGDQELGNWKMLNSV